MSRSAATSILSTVIQSVVQLTCVFAALASAAALKNITITVPDGTSNHGDSTLLCTPTKWTDIVLFYLGNYFAHAATVITLPGESPLSAALAAAMALLLPTSGVRRGLNAIQSGAVFEKTDLHTAARAGALCMAVRADSWMPHPNDLLSSAVYQLKVLHAQSDDEIVSMEAAEAAEAAETSGSVGSARDLVERKVHTVVFNALWQTTGVVSPLPWRTTVHGSIKLPAGYQLADVPRDADFITNPQEDNEEKTKTTIAYNYSAVKALVAIGQSVYAATTLYSSRGDQIKKYGYAAFGLTVAPYAVMSVANLLGSLITPQYPCRYLVDSTILDEARKRKGYHVDGIVGRLAELELPARLDITSSYEDLWLAGPVQFSVSLELKLRARFQGHLIPFVEKRLSRRHRLAPASSSEQAELTSSILFDIPVVDERRQESPPHSSSRSNHTMEMEQPAPEPERIFTRRQSTSRPQSGPPIQIETPNSHVSPSSDSDYSSSSSYLSYGTGSLVNYDATLYIPTCPLIKLCKQKRNQVRCHISHNRHEDSLLYTNVGIPAWTRADGILESFIISLISLAIIGGLSGFKPGQSTAAQRGWTMAWWVCGIVFGVNVGKVLVDGFVLLWYGQGRLIPRKLSLFFPLAAVSGVTSVGGYIVVGKMLASYGSCVKIS